MFNLREQDFRVDPIEKVEWTEMHCEVQFIILKYHSDNHLQASILITYLFVHLLFMFLMVFF